MFKEAKTFLHKKAEVLCRKLIRQQNKDNGNVFARVLFVLVIPIEYRLRPKEDLKRLEEPDRED